MESEHLRSESVFTYYSQEHYLFFSPIDSSLTTMIWPWLLKYIQTKTDSKLLSYDTSSWQNQKADFVLFVRKELRYWNGIMGYSCLKSDLTYGKIYRTERQVEEKPDRNRNTCTFTGNRLRQAGVQTDMQACRCLGRWSKRRVYGRVRQREIQTDKSLWNWREEIKWPNRNKKVRGPKKKIEIAFCLIFYDIFKNM